MKSNTKSMLLTLVLVFMSNVGWGQKKCTAEKGTLELAESKLTECGTSEPKQKCPDYDTRVANRIAANRAYSECTDKTNDDKEECKTITDRINKRNETFGVEAQKKALECMEGGQDTEAGATRGILMGLGGMPTGSESVCAAGAEKSPYADQLERKMTMIEKLEKEIKAIDEKIIKQKKDSMDKLAEMNEDRIKLKEAWDKRQTDQEAEQGRALNAMRENQIKVQEAIRKANAELINARQDMAKAERKRSEELLKAGVQSFSSMSRICNAQLKDYYKKAELNKKKKSGSLGSALGKGSSKKNDLQSFKDDCLKSMEEKRNAIYEDTSNYLVQMVNNIQDRQAAITTLENEYKNQADNYKKAIEREAGSLSKDQQAFLQKDQILANKIAEYQQTSAQEANQLIQQKIQASQSLSAAINSKGTITEAETKLGVRNLKEFMNDVQLLAGPAMVDGVPQKGIKPKCEDFERFRSEAEEFKELRGKDSMQPAQR